MSERVAIVGASHKPDRYSNMAFHELIKHGHRVFLIHPVLKTIENQPVYASLGVLPEPVETVTMYVSEDISTGMREALLTLKPRRVIFNPGAENPELKQRLLAQGIEAVDHCTLVLLRTDQF